MSQSLTNVYCATAFRTEQTACGQFLFVCKTNIVKGLFCKTFCYRTENDETLEDRGWFQNIHIYICRKAIFEKGLQKILISKNVVFGYKLS